MFHQAEKDMFSVRLSIIPACKHAWLSGNAQTAIALADDIIARAVAIIRRVEASLGRLDAAIKYARTGGVEGRTAIYAALSFICEVNKLGDKDFGLQRAYKLAQRANGFGATVFTARMREVCCHELTRSFAVAMPTGEVVAVDAYAQAAFTYDAKRDGHAFKGLSQQVAAGQRLGRSGATGNVTGPHLHFEVRTAPGYGSDIDPVAWLGRHGVHL